MLAVRCRLVISIVVAVVVVAVVVVAVVVFVVVWSRKTDPFDRVSMLITGVPVNQY